MAIPTFTRDAGGKAGIRLLVAGALALMLLPLVSGPASAEEFSNPTPIVVPLPGPPAGCPPGCGDPAQPYPSTINVSGLQGTVTDVNVVIRDLAYDNFGPPDIDLMLVAPDGSTRVMLMSDACGTNAAPNPIETPITLTFDDQAATPLPADSACSTGTFRPIDDDDDGEFAPVFESDFFAPPAPDEPAGSLPLSTFNSIDPNGTWSLYMMDDFPGDQPAEGEAGRIGGGWTLQVTGGGTTTTSSTSTTTTSSTSTTTTTTGTGATTTTTAAGATTTIAATTPTTAGPILRLSSTQVAPGERVTVAGDRLAANTSYQLTFNSASVSLGTATTNASGSFQTVVTIPSDATAGAHQITASDSSGRVVASVNLTVVRSGSPAATSGLARTGSDVQTLTLLGASVILLGIAIVSSGPKPRRVAVWTGRRRW